MDIKEIRESGLLELYVIGDCSASDRVTVEKALEEFPELENDLKEIAASLGTYASLHGQKPSPNIKHDLLNQITSDSKHAIPDQNAQVGKSSIFKWISALSILTSLVLGFLYFNTTQDQLKLQDDYDRYRIMCDSLELEREIEYALLNQIQHPENEILPFTATNKYANASFYLIHNKAIQQNFIQINNLPPITNQQSYQLWSLKPNLAPIPLSVFQGDEGIIIPVDFEENTATYAITIEPRGGQNTPSLDDLIGTVNV